MSATKGKVAKYDTLLAICTAPIAATFMRGKGVCGLPGWLALAGAPALTDDERRAAPAPSAATGGGAVEGERPIREGRASLGWVVGRVLCRPVSTLHGRTKPACAPGVCAC